MEATECCSHDKQHCWHMHSGEYFAEEGKQKFRASEHCCFCNQTRYLVCDATLQPPKVHGKYLYQGMSLNSAPSSMTYQQGCLQRDFSFFNQMGKNGRIDYDKGMPGSFAENWKP